MRFQENEHYATVVIHVREQDAKHVGAALDSDVAYLGFSDGRYGVTVPCEVVAVTDPLPPVEPTREFVGLGLACQRTEHGIRIVEDKVGRNTA